jgi:hypothetical protein
MAAADALSVRVAAAEAAAQDAAKRATAAELAAAAATTRAQEAETKADAAGLAAQSALAASSANAECVKSLRSELAAVSTPGAAAALPLPLASPAVSAALPEGGTLPKPHSSEAAETAALEAIARLQMASKAAAAVVDPSPAATRAAAALAAARLRLRNREKGGGTAAEVLPERVGSVDELR